MEKSLLASLYRFHVYHTTRRLLEELRVALPGDKSHSRYDNPYNSRAYQRLCFEFGVSPDTDWRQKLDHGFKISDLGVPSRLHLEHIDMCMWCKAHSFTRGMPCVITVISQESGRRSLLTNRRASRRRVWSVLMTRSAHMFGLSWERKPRLGRIFSRPGRDLTPRSNFWQISKTRLPRPLTSPVASLGIREHCNMHPDPWTLCSGLGSICRRATWHSIRATSRGTTTRSR